LLGTAGQRKDHKVLVKMEPIVRGDETVSFSGPVEVDVTIESVNRGVLLVDGDVSADLTLTCSRCLCGFNEAYGAPLKETFCTPTQMKDDEECYEIAGHEIDLGPAVEQAFLLALPMKILCDEACRGLCQVCGANLNQNREHGHEAAPDTRLTELGRLLESGWKEGGGEGDD